MARQNWNELKNAIVADPASVTGTAEALLVPDWTFNAQEIQAESVIHGIVHGKITTDATAGNLTLRLRWGGLAGTSIAASANFALANSQTDITWMFEFWITCRASGDSTTAMTVIAFGEAAFGAAASSNVPILVPASAPAQTASLDGSVAKALSVTAQMDNTGNTLQAMSYALDVLN